MRECSTPSSNNMTSEPSVQFSLFGARTDEKVVNVASIPQRSPFRYPGGKTWLVPRVRCWLRSQPEKPSLFVEPFAGGGIIGLTVAFENLAERVLMVELDEDVAAVWKTILEGEAEWLAQRIERFPFSAQHVNDTLNEHPHGLREQAFATILRNRVNRGGILAPGAGRIKDGENGRGMSSRWYPETLAKRIRAIGTIADRIDFIQSDGLGVMQSLAQRDRTAFFVDPPYTAGGKRAGSRLYKHSELDHEALFRLAARVKGDVLLTYDNAEDVRCLAEAHGFAVQPVAMKSTHHAEMKELLIGRSLRWA